MTSHANDNTTVRFASVCSGIEGVSAAWEPLGSFEPVFFSEIEAFPSAVLAHHFPGTPNLGDLTKIDGAAWTGKVDVLWGSTPCQSLSIAGKQAGLDDPRGQLTLKFVELADTINPTFTAWENVKNALSVQKGSAFGQFLGALAGSGHDLVPPDGSKWGNAGYVVGPSRTVAWRVFDAQYGGLAQRRERLFVVACPRTSGHDPRDILFERGEPGRDRPPMRDCGSENSASSAKAAWYLNGDTRPKINREFAATLKADTASGCRASVAIDGVIRRLTSTEWERLQGFPDGWTDILWRGGTAPDTLRKKAIGNSLAIPDVRWIGQRIKASVQGQLVPYDWQDNIGGRQTHHKIDFNPVKHHHREFDKFRWTA